MKKISLLFCFAMLTAIIVGCGGHEQKVIEPTDTGELSETEKEMESEDYEKAMNEMGN